MLLQGVEEGTRAQQVGVTCLTSQVNGGVGGTPVFYLFAQPAAALTFPAAHILHFLLDRNPFWHFPDVCFMLFYNYLSNEIINSLRAGTMSSQTQPSFIQHLMICKAQTGPEPGAVGAVFEEPAALCSPLQGGQLQPQ